MTSPEVTRYGYDRVGNLDWTERPGQMAIDYVYDNLDRLIDEIYFVDNDDDHIVDWFDLNGDDVYQTNEGERPLARFSTTRDIQGQRIAANDRSYLTNQTNRERSFWTYDALGRVEREEYRPSTDFSTGSNSAPGFVQWHEYDLNSNRIRLTRDESQAFIKLFQHDANDRLIQEQVDILAPGDTTDPVTTYTYGTNNAGTQITRQSTVDRGGLVGGIEKEITTFLYDAAGRQSSHQYINALNFTQSTTTYVYSIAGHRVAQTTSNLGTSTYLIDPQSPTGYAEVLLEQRPFFGTFHYILGPRSRTSSGDGRQNGCRLCRPSHGSLLYPEAI